MTSRGYRRLNAWLAAALFATALAPRALTLAPDGGALLLPGGTVIPEFCVVKRATGRECPSCHLGRSVVLASHLDLTGSLEHHHGGVMVLGWVVAHGLVRAALALFAVALPRRWWLDLTFSLGSFAAVGLAMAAVP